MNTLRWLRVVGDTLFAFGAFAFVAFIGRLAIKPRPATARMRSRSCKDDRSASWILRLARYLAIFLARVFVILYDEATEEDLRALRAYEVRRILSEVDGQLTKNPTTPTRRKKLLAGLAPPWVSVRPVWQLRIGDFRAFYDVDEERQEVIVRAIRRKGSKTTKEIL